MLKSLKLPSGTLNRPWYSRVLIMLVAAVVSQTATAGKVSNLFNFDLHTTAAGVVQGPKDSAYEGYVYGTTSDVSRTSGGTIFRVPITGGAPEIIHQFSTSEGYSPRATLLMSADGYLYGTTHNSSPTENKLSSGGGTVFRIRPDGSQFQTLHDFGGATNNPNVDDSVFPDFALVEDTVHVYGVAKFGGANKTGLIYRINKSTGEFLPPWIEFPPATAISPGVYGPVTMGTSRGLIPNASLVLANNKLYGVTQYGGTNAVTGASDAILAGAGTIYEIDPAAQSPVATTIFNFDSLDTAAARVVNTSGANPAGSLVKAGSETLLVGTTTTGGKPAGGSIPGYGTVYRLDVSGSPATVTVLHVFDNVHGATPAGRLVYRSVGAEEYVYGVTASGAGTIFKVAPDAAAYDSNAPAPDPTGYVVYALVATEGTAIQDGLALGTDQSLDLYLVAKNGGACTGYSASGYGAVLRYSFNNMTYPPYSNCTNISSSGGGAFQMPWLWMLGALGLVPPLRRWFGVRHS